MNSVKFVSDKGKEFTLKKNAVSNINSKSCINCGTCREVCPVGAISENQRTICRVCPECTERDALTLDEMYTFAIKKACTTACPLGISPQGYVNLTKLGKLDEAYKLIWDKIPLPSVCARICHHPCEQACKRGDLIDTPIAIRGIKRYLSDVNEYNIEKYPSLYEETIAIVGAGPAGLTAGHYLSQLGYAVTIYEGAAEAGGMLKRGIPEFRLPRNVVDKDIANLEAAGLTIKLDERIDKFTMEKIKKDYDVVIVAAGAPNSKELKIEGWRMSGVMTAMNLMERINNHMEIQRHPGQIFKFNGEVVVIGGGSVALDAARAAVRLGAAKVTVVSLESGECLACHSWELEEAKEEGVILMEGYSPNRFVGLYPTLDGVELCKVTSFNKDATGKIACSTDKDNKTMIKADWVIVAIGQAADGMWSELKDSNVLFAGDVDNSACSVIDAMASGRNIALKVDTDLRGRVLKDTVSEHELNHAPIMEKIYPYTRRKTMRPEIPLLDVNNRINSFAEVEGIFNDQQVHDEVLRCLNCGYQTVDEEKCIGCGVCQRMCPKRDVIKMISANEGGNV